MELTDEQADAALGVLYSDGFDPYLVNGDDYVWWDVLERPTDEKRQRAYQYLQVADAEALSKSRDLMRQAIEAALTTGE